MATLDSINILNAIKADASEFYKANVPTATQTNITKVGDKILGSTTLTNEFIADICTKVAMSNFSSKVFKNPLSIFKKADSTLGNYGTIEDIYIAPAPDRLTSTKATDLLVEENPKGKTAYYALNRESTLKQTFSETKLRNAFKSSNDFMQLYTQIVNSIYSGDNVAEFQLLKNTIGSAVANGTIPRQEVPTATEPKALAKLFANTARAFQFPSTRYVPYNKKNEVTDVVTWTDASDIVLLIPSAIQTDLDYDVLANAFNLSIVDIRQKTILVDEIPNSVSGETTLGVIMDRNALKCIDAKLKPMTFQNPETDSITFYLHHWQYYFVSMFCNALAVVMKDA